MWKQHRALSLIALVLILLLAFLSAERVRGAVKLQAWREAMRARGECFTVAELQPRVTGSVRVLTPLEFQGLMTGLGTTASYPSGMRSVLPGRARTISKLESWNDSRRSTNSWDALEPSLASLRPQLASLGRTLSERPLHIEIDYSQGFSAPLIHLNSLKNAALRLSAGTLDALHRGELAEAETNLLTLTTLMELPAQERFVVGQLVHDSVTYMAVAAVWEALQAKGWSDEALERIQQSWERHDWLRSMADCLAMERAVGAEYFDRRKHPDGELIQSLLVQPMASLGLGGYEPDQKGGLAALLGPLMEASRGFRERLYLVLWRFAWADQDQLLHHQTVQQALDTIQTAITERSWPSTFPWLPDNPTAWNRFRHWITWQALTAVPQTTTKAVQCEQAREFVLAAAALRRFELRNRTLPASLTELVPQYLPRLPRDWYRGAELTYQRLDPHRFLLYSYGQNRVDDHGDPRLDEGEGRSWMVGRDVVWPSPATPDEIAKAVR